MAVPEQTPYIEHTGNGATTSFSLGFQCESKDHLIVLVDEIEPPIATWSLSGGNVVFTTAPAAGKKITLQRNTPFNRTTDYQSYNNSFRPPAVNKDFDWIWWKLQELGVADWILSNRINDLRAYVDKQDNVLQDNIDSLKNYVDDKDDELRNYLLSAIQEQGVALDQLEEYYSYLMQQLAQVAIDRGWSASFIVSADGSTQQQVNDRIGNTWYAKPLGYKLNSRVMLTNGYIVKSTVANNTVNPNVSMTGWLFAADSVNLKMFGGDPLGLVASDTAFIKMCAYSKNNNVPIKNNSGTYLLSGDKKIIVGFNADFSGSVFKLSADFSGKIVVGDNATQVKYESGNSNFDQLKTATQALKGEASIDILKSNNFLDDQYVKFSSSQQMFRYRGEIQTRKEFNKVLRRGQLRHTFLYDFDFSLLTSVLAQKRIGAWEVKGIAVDESALTGDRILDVIIARNTNNLRLKGTSFVNNATELPLDLSLRRVNVENVYDSEIDGMDVPSTTYDENQNAYTIIHGNTLNLKVKNVNADGDGWGAFGGFDNRAITYEYCKVSRIDYHTPFQEYLRSINCDIGNLGYNICGMGDLIINGGSVTLRKESDSGREGMSYFVRSRPDSGGFIDGDLIANNVKLTGYFEHSNRVFSLLTVNPYSVGQSDPVVGSPIDYTFFKNVRVNNLMSDAQGIDTTYLIYSYQSLKTLFLKPPKKIMITGELSPSILAIELCRFVNRDNVDINISNFNVDSIRFLHNASYVSQKISFNGSNLNPTGRSSAIDGTGVNFRNFCDGYFTIKDSKINTYTEIEGSTVSAFNPILNVLNNDVDLRRGGSAFINRSTAMSQAPAKTLISENRITTSDGQGTTYTSLRNMLAKYKSVKNIIDNRSILSKMFQATSEVSSASVTINTADTKAILSIQSGTSAEGFVFDTATISIGLANSVTLPSGGTVVVSDGGGTTTITVNKTSLKSIDVIDFC